MPGCVQTWPVYTTARVQLHVQWQKKWLHYVILIHDKLFSASMTIFSKLYIKHLCRQSYKPRFSYMPCFTSSAVCKKQRKKPWGFLPCDSWHRHHMLSCLYVAIAVQWRRLILHSVLATKTCTDGQQHQAYKTYSSWKEQLRSVAKRHL